MIRWYIWPVEEAGDRRGPKYLKWIGHPGQTLDQWAMADYGLMPTALLVADVTPAQHAQAAAQPDIVTIPENIDNTISGAALSVVTAELEALHIPSSWVTTSHTYRDVMRRVAHLFLFAQKYSGRHARRLIEAGFNLNTQISDLPTNVRVSLNDTAQSFGWDTSAIQGAWTVRQALWYLADQWGNEPILMGGQEL